jgi:uncharacterized protein (DUF1330 family)
MTNGDYLPKVAIPLALLAGIALGAAVTSTLHAQVKPAVYSVDQAFGDVDLTGISEYMHDYVPIAQASIKAYGGKVLAESSTVTTFSGSSPKRAAIVLWPNIDQFDAWYNSPEYAQAREIGGKYTKFHIFVVEAADTHPASLEARP